jgi:hypothetical protein
MTSVPHRWPPDALPSSENDNGSVSRLSPESIALSAKTVADWKTVRMMTQIIVEFSSLLLSELSTYDPLTTEKLSGDLLTANDALLTAVRNGTLTPEHIATLEAAQTAALHFLEEGQS